MPEQWHPVFHLPHLAQATQGLVFIWIRMLLDLVLVYSPPRAIRPNVCCL